MEGQTSQLAEGCATSTPKKPSQVEDQLALMNGEITILEKKFSSLVERLSPILGAPAEPKPEEKAEKISLSAPLAENLAEKNDRLSSLVRRIKAITELVEL